MKIKIFFSAFLCVLSVSALKAATPGGSGTTNQIAIWRTAKQLGNSGASMDNNTNMDVPGTITARGGTIIISNAVGFSALILQSSNHTVTFGIDTASGQVETISDNGLVFNSGIGSTLIIANDAGWQFFQGVLTPGGSNTFSIGSDTRPLQDLEAVQVTIPGSVNFANAHKTFILRPQAGGSGGGIISSDAEILLQAGLDVQIQALAFNVNAPSFFNDVVYAPTNTAPNTIIMTDFVLNRFYTNAPQRASVSVSFTNTSALTGNAIVGLYIDDDADGIFDQTGITAGALAAVAVSQISEISAEIPPGARFVFTNLSGTGGSVAIRTGSSRWVKK